MEWTEAGNQCYDFLNIFAEKRWRKNVDFDLNYETFIYAEKNEHRIDFQSKLLKIEIKTLKPI
jgi:hypothetical protein